MPKKRKFTTGRLITLEEAAEMLRLPRPHPDKADAKEKTPLRTRQRRAVLRLIQAGRLAGVEIAGAWRVYESSVLQLMASGSDYDPTQPSDSDEKNDPCNDRIRNQMPDTSGVSETKYHNSRRANHDES